VARLRIHAMLCGGPDSPPGSIQEFETIRTECRAAYPIHSTPSQGFSIPTRRCIAAAAQLFSCQTRIGGDRETPSIDRSMFCCVPALRRHNRTGSDQHRKLPLAPDQRSGRTHQRLPPPILSNTAVAGDLIGDRGTPPGTTTATANEHENRHRPGSTGTSMLGSP